MKKYCKIWILAFLLMTLVGCDFFGGGETTTTTNKITESTTIPDFSITISFETNGGSPIENAVIDASTVTINIPEPTKEGYDFAGWYNESSLINRFVLTGTTPSNVTIYAKWEPKEYTITFEENGGTIVADITQDYQTTITLPTNLTKQGYIFGGWYTESNLANQFTQSKMPLDGATLYAKWIPDYVDVTVRFYTQNLDLNGYSLNKTEVFSGISDSTYEAPIHDVTGFTYDATNANNIRTGVVLPDGSLVLRLYYNRNTYTISFVTNATISVQSISGLYQSSVLKPSDPVRLGYSFVGWYQDQDLTIPYVFDKMPAENISVYAKWQGQPSTIYFNTLTSESIPALEENNGETISLPQPTREGYAFAGWYKDENYQYLFTDTVMPVGGATLYAKWEINSYTLTFDTMGGSIITAVEYDYLELIVKPANPTKEGYIFDGWYIDQALTVEFVFSTMVSSDITIYAKWIDNSNPYSILSQTNKQPGEAVDVEGIVYAKHGSDYLGYYIYDETGFLYIEAANDAIALGDKVQLSGYLAFNQGVPYVEGVTSVSEISSENPLPLAQDIEYDQIFTDNMVYQSFKVRGMLVKSDLIYKVVEPITHEEVKMYYQSFDDSIRTEFVALNNQMIDFEFVLVKYETEYRAVLIEASLVPLSTQEKLSLMDDIIADYLLNNTFLPGSDFDVLMLNFFALGNISNVAVDSSFEQYYDSLSTKFKDTNVEVTVPFALSVRVDEQDFTLDINVPLKPIVISSLSALTTSAEGTYHQIEVTVVCTNSDSKIMILNDGTESIYAINKYNLQIGDKAIFMIRLDKEKNMIFLDGDGDIVLHQLVSRENELGLLPTGYTMEDYLNLDVTDASIYGDFVEVRGYIVTNFDDELYPFALVSDNLIIPIKAVGHGAFEQLFNYEYSEVIIRGFVFGKTDNQLALFYEGKRFDIRLPEYTDEELLLALEESFFLQYAGKRFSAFDYFEMMPYHRVMGGIYTWEIDEATLPYYDLLEKRFTYSETEVTLSFTITIAVNSVSKQIVFNPVLNPVAFTDFDFIKGSGNYGEAFVKGIVWYWHPDFVYLVNGNNELLKVEVSNLGAYKGDLVILYGNIGYNLDTEEKYLYNYDNDEALKIIVSRDNLVGLTATVTDAGDFLASDIHDLSTYTQYLQISGQLKKYRNFVMILETADGYFYIEPVDDYTYFELVRLEGRFVNLKAYSYKYAYNSALGEMVHYLRYTGQPDDLEILGMTDQQKVDYIKEYILTNYQIEFESGNSFDFEAIGLMFPEVGITFTEKQDTLNLIDLSDDYSFYISEVLNDNIIIITAAIATDTVSETFDFNFTVLSVKEAVVTSITDIVVDSHNIYMIEAKVVSVTAVASNLFMFLVEDASGMMFVQVGYNDYYYYDDWDGYIGETVRFTGEVVSLMNRDVMLTESMSVYSRTGSVSKLFSDTSIYALNTRDDISGNYYGDSVSLFGTLEVVYSDIIEYYISDGNNKIRILTSNYGFSSIQDYAGYLVKINGFVYGKDELGNVAIMYYNYNYDGTKSLQINPYSDQEVALLVKNYFEGMIPDYSRIYIEGEYFYEFYLPSALDANFSIEVTYSFGAGTEYLTEYGTYYEISAPEFDMIVPVTIDIVVGEAHEVVTFDFVIDGYLLGSLNDLFEASLEVDEVALAATVIYSGFGFHYFLIEEEVYYLKAYVNSWFSEGDEVVIIGKKISIDGVTDYTYDINVINKNYGPEPDLIARESSIQELYDNDYEINLIHREANTIYGRLGYDDYAKMYTLTYNGEMVYIRVNNMYEDWDYLNNYLNDYIYLDVLLPMEYYRNEFWIVDIFGAEDARMPVYGGYEEALPFIKEKLMGFDELVVYSGDRLDEVISTYDWNHNISLSFGLTDPSYSEYFDPSISYVINIVGSEVTIPVRVNINDGDGSLIDYADINITIKPLVESPVLDVLKGVEGKIYQVEGVIVALQVDSDGDYQSMIVDDGLNRIYVRFFFLDGIFEGEDLSLAVGDRVEVIGVRSFYDSYGFVPCIDDIRVVNTLSSGNSFDNTPVMMTWEELLALDYTDPTIYTQYVEITGTIDWNGSTSYPTYYLLNYDLFDDYNYEYYRIELFGDTYTEFNNYMNGFDGDVVTIRGYLLGFRYIYSYCDWKIHVDEVITE